MSKKKKVTKNKPAKKVVKKTAKKSVSKQKKTPKIKIEKPLRLAQGKPLGEVTHFYGGIKVAVIKCKMPMKTGSEVEIRGATTHFAQKIESLQFNHAVVKIAKKGQSVGMKVKKRVRPGDEVFVGNN